MTSKRVVVTGASGFVGRHLCRQLVDAGREVRTLVHSAPSPDLLPGAVEPVIGPDITEPLDWRALLAGADAVVHLVARTHVMRETAADPGEVYRRINVAPVGPLVEACGAAGVARFVFLSSIKALGEGAPEPYTETTPCRPANAYGATKLAAEQVVTEAGRRWGVETVILRPPLVYGPHVEGNFLRLLQQARSRLPLPLGAVRNQRSLVFVGNLVSAIAHVLDDPRAAGQLFHVADRETPSTAELIFRLAALLGRRKRLPAVPVPLLRWAGRMLGRTDDVNRLLDSLTVSSEHLRRRLDWTPPFSLEQGLQQTVRWFADSGLRNEISNGTFSPALNMAH